MTLSIEIADVSDVGYSEEISGWYLKSSLERGIGIAVRKPEYLRKKILKRHAIIAKYGTKAVGFCYIESFEKKQYVSNSGLIVQQAFRGKGLSKKIKSAAFTHARDIFPDAKIFGITTSEIVMKLNSALGYIPVPLIKLTCDEDFWAGCSSCRNYDILIRNNKQMCLCTGMLFQPERDPILQNNNLTNAKSK